MAQRLGLMLAAIMLSSSPLHAQQSVCDLFEDLRKSSGPHQISIKGELFLNEKVSALASADCDNEFVESHYRWPTVINLRASEILPQSKRRALENAAAQIQRIQKQGKVTHATAVFSGRLSLKATGQ